MRHPTSRLSVFQFKTHETQPELKSIQYQAIFSRFWPLFSRFRPLFSKFRPLFSKFRPLFHLNPSISSTINTRSSRTSDFSSRFGRNLAVSDGISPDLGWIWKDLAKFGEISPRFKGFRWDRFHPKPTTTRRRLKSMNPLLLRVSCRLKNHPPELLWVSCGLGKNPTRPTHGQPYWHVNTPSKVQVTTENLTKYKVPMQMKQLSGQSKRDHAKTRIQTSMYVITNIIKGPKTTGSHHCFNIKIKSP